MSFDIASFADWNPPFYLCQRCRSIYTAGDQGIEKEYTERHTKVQKICKTCGATENFNEISRSVSDVQKLARIARRLPPYSSVERMSSPLASLHQSLGLTRHFVHFLTYSIDTAFLGALSILVQNGVQVRGIVGNRCHEIITSTSETFMQEFWLDFVIAMEGYNTHSVDINHTKLIIIDGLLAFHGSANLTMNGWAKASGGSMSESVQVTANTAKVIEWNNKMFAKKWEPHRDLEWKYCPF